MPDPLLPALSGAALLHDPHCNRGSAFSLAQRRALRLEGLLPPVPATLETQVGRVHTQLDMLDTDLQRYLFLSDLQSRNEVLFYAVLMTDPAKFMPLVYTPTLARPARSLTTSFARRAGFICRSQHEAG